MPWSRPLGDLLPPVIGPVLSRRGFGLPGLVLYWEDIAGKELAAVSRPVKVQRCALPRRPGQGGMAPAALHVWVEPSCALELQHLAPVIIERVNVQLGWRCVGRLVLMQGPVAALPPARRRAAPPFDQRAEAAAAALIGNGLDPSLQEALARLGAHVLAGT